jgi:hypothetical protein
MPLHPQSFRTETMQWNAFEREMAQRAEAHITALGLTNPKQIFLAAREEIYATYQEHWQCTRKQCDGATIIKISVMTTHSCLLKHRSFCGLLYTFGYSMLGAVSIIEQLVQLDVVIDDIRFSPRSRVHRWRQPYLRNWLGNQYIHLPALGNMHYNDDQDIELADPVAGVPQVLQQLQVGKHVALMCVCKEYEECHRRNVAELILEQLPDVIVVPFPSLESYV